MYLNHYENQQIHFEVLWKLQMNLEFSNMCDGRIYTLRPCSPEFKFCSVRQKVNSKWLQSNIRLWKIAIK